MCTHFNKFIHFTGLIGSPQLKGTKPMSSSTSSSNDGKFMPYNSTLCILKPLILALPVSLSHSRSLLLPPSHKFMSTKPTYLKEIQAPTMLQVMQTFTIRPLTLERTIQLIVEDPLDTVTSRVNPFTCRLDPFTPHVDPFTPRVDPFTPRVDPSTPRVYPFTPPASILSPFTPFIRSLSKLSFNRLLCFVYIR